MVAAKRLPDREILEDLCSRFILNGAQEDLESFERLMFTIEQAHWFYEDFFREKDLTLKSLSLKEFTGLIFAQCPGLEPYAKFTADIYKGFTAYKQKVPVLGAIILNPSLDKVLMVRGYKSGASWTFPRGKISKGEADAECAIREVEEETALNISPWLVEEDFIEMHLGEQRCKLYIIAGVEETQQFAPLARKEIGGFGWYHIAHLPATKEADTLIKNKFYNVYPFVKQLRRWIKNKRRNQKGAQQPVKQVSAPAPQAPSTAGPSSGAPAISGTDKTRVMVQASSHMPSGLSGIREPGQAWLHFHFDWDAIMQHLTVP